MKFKVKIGRHVGEDKRVYNAGEIVKSDHPLHTMFPEKFAVIEGPKEDKSEEDQVPGQELQDDTEKVGTHVKDNPATPKSPLGTLHAPRRTSVAKPDPENEDDEGGPEDDEKPSGRRRRRRKSSKTEDTDSGESEE